MKLYLNKASPYARLVMVVIHEKRLADSVELAWTDPWASPPDLLAINPLAKVPALITDGGLPIIDSVCICMHRHSDRRSGVVFVKPVHGGKRAVAAGRHEFVALLLLRAVGQMETLAVYGTQLLQPRSARLAYRFIARERARHVIGHRLEQ